MNVNRASLVVLCVSVIAAAIAVGYWAGHTRATQAATPPPTEQAVPIDTSRESMLDESGKRMSLVIREGLFQEAEAIRRAAGSRTATAMSVPRDGFVFVLHPDGRASIVKSDGIVQPVVSEWHAGLSPYDKPMLFSPAGEEKHAYRPFDFNMSGLAFDPEWDVYTRVDRHAERAKEKQK